MGLAADSFTGAFSWFHDMWGVTTADPERRRRLDEAEWCASSGRRLSESSAPLSAKQSAAMLVHMMGSRLTSMCCAVADVLAQLADQGGFQKLALYQKLLFKTATGDWAGAAGEMGSCFGHSDCDALKATMTAGCPEKPWYAIDAGYKADFQKDVNDGAQRWEPGPITDAYRKYDYDSVPTCTLACGSNSTIKGRVRTTRTRRCARRSRRATKSARRRSALDRATTATRRRRG